MNDPFVSYDTFSVGAEFDAQQESAAPAAPKDIPLLARLQRLSTPAQKTTKRFDEAESIITGAHVAEAAVAGYDLEPPPIADPKRALAGSPTTTIRIDTVSPTAYDEFAGDLSPSPAAPTAEPAAFTASPGDETLEDPWAAWLLNLESAVLPYSRLIVLAAVIAALGLTLVLLQGGTAPTDTTGGVPQVQIETADSVLAATPNDTPPLWSGEPAETKPVASLADNGLRPLDLAAPAAHASGPASAARGPGRATLVGDVQPVTPTRVNVAGQPNFSQTK